MVRTASSFSCRLYSSSSRANTSARASRRFECERSVSAQQAIDLARVVAPDLIVLDACVEAALELVEALAVARKNDLPDVVAMLEKKLGISKEVDGETPALGNTVPTLPDGRPLQ